jgi:hypothetical protein
MAKWGVSAGSLLGGVVTLFVFRRGLPHVGWIAGYLILLWLVFAVFVQVRQSLEERGRRLVIAAIDYTIQTLYHGLLLFVLPAYFASTTFTSVNAWFFFVLATVTLLTAIDPWYRALILPRRWAGHALLTFSIFAALNVALPLVGLTPELALSASAFLAVFAMTLTLRQGGALSWTGAWARAGGFAVLAVALLWVLRAWIPPAPLHLARATLARSVSGLEPVDPIAGSIGAATLRSWGSLVAYTAVSAPAGLNQPIVHVWQKDGEVVTTIPLSPVRGGRREGFRTYSRKSDFKADPSGRWSVDVVTASGQLIGRLRFTVTP